LLYIIFDISIKERKILEGNIVERESEKERRRGRERGREGRRERERVLI